MRLSTPKPLLVAAGGVAALAAAAGIASAASTRPIGAFTTKGAYSFASAPGLHPPRLHTTRRTSFKQLAPGYFMVANFPNLTATESTPPKATMIGQSGPLMLDSRLQPVWFRPAPIDTVATNLKAQTYAGKPVLSWWQGVITNTGATQSGEDVVVNQHYQTVAVLKGDTADGWVLSEHEIIIRGHDAWVTAYRNVPMNLTSYHGAATGSVTDAAVQEYDLRTGKLLYTWDALEHLPLSSSLQPAPPVAAFPWDAYHINSINLVGSQQFLVSMRNTWAAYLVDVKTGKTVWTLTDSPRLKSTFKVASNAQFQWQHDVELHSGNVVSIFDDACCQITGNPANPFLPPSGHSRGLVLKLDSRKHTASLAGQYRDPNTTEPYAAFLGNTDLLPNGNVAVGWGSTPFFSEFTRSGKLLLNANWPGPDLSYRAFVQRWVGLPLYPPSGAAVTRKKRSTVYASWNGATRVTAWRVLAGSNPKHLRVVARAGRDGFETAIRLPHAYKWFRVQALGARGRVIGATKAFKGKG